MNRARVYTPARLHFGLLAYGGESRQFGGAGLMLEKPGVELTAATAPEFRVSGEGTPAFHERVRTIAEQVAGRLGLPPIEVRLLRAPSPHVGLGAGTQSALAVAAALSRLAGRTSTAAELAAWTGRGLRSAIGAHGFANGGFIIDGGKTRSEPLAPCVARLDFPVDWPVLLLHPPLPSGLHGDQERQAFAKGLSIPEAATDQLCRLLLLGMAPAVAAGDYFSFAAALYEFNRTVGECFASAQGGPYAHPSLERLIHDLRREGVSAVGQTSWGPTIFAILPDENRTASLSDWMRRRHPAVGLTQTRANNLGAFIEGARASRLLVSVRSAAEAAAALAGGAEIIDVKEPSRGALGAADFATVAEVVATVRSLSPLTPVTAALGELMDAENLVAAGVAAPTGLMLWKVGFAGERADNSWRERFLRVREAFAASAPIAPAIYADARRAQSPPWPAILEAAVAVKAPFVLLDTYFKDQVLRESFDAAELRSLFEAARRRNIPLALAGSLTAGDLPELFQTGAIRPAVVAVRGAVCRSGVRTAEIDAERVAEFRRRLGAATCNR